MWKMKDTISKLLIGTISPKELIELKNWLHDPINQADLESYVRDYHDMNLATLKNNVDKAYKKVIEHIDGKEKPKKGLIPNWTKYAAIIVLFLGVVFSYQQGLFSSQTQKKVLIPKEEDITLKLENGTVQTIDLNQTKEVRNASGNIIGNQNQNRISYSQATPSEALVFNTLTVPKGKRFELELSDGTSVHLNSGSSLRYPVSFQKEGVRQVFLSGEAYFNVAKDKLNSFTINANELDVTVLGTEFNISSYKEDKNIDVVLVEGAVSLSGKNRSKNEVVNLLPGEKASFAYASQDINVGKVNISLYTSWRDGHLVFRDTTFENILTKLERRYNVQIENKNKELGEEIFNASFNDVPIEKVLSYFNDTHKINYTIADNKVIINESK